MSSSAKQLPAAIATKRISAKKRGRGVIYLSWTDYPISRSGSFSSRPGGKPARDLEFSVHHLGVASIDGEVDALENDERLRLLHVVKEMNKRIPGTFAVESSVNAPVVRRSFA